ncbi:galactosylgalactosylxylosylprotein 3-beta-glucuronosyltransferase 3-like [Actinia tenebrosa]|uniref:Galactosylgalactosylxylosylprotein 3-beta-glucuronosyltransferase n=1 Tax=Actinia tenebrosa TaxID=6105 RepID=A0A6P8IVL6_ACTTE|nr:galactosylgalactosylxylosylprotein 3-beta-glucuronosyltransferase 3-like [Actinia tenebrosa]XP_031570173.1 galactosylgalactosylxylosylprotein 3-beta-glucuronosyltransferase 3-like [Actinia tenebrosa]
MARKELAVLLAFLIAMTPLTYFVVKEELRQSRRMSRLKMHSDEIEDAINVANLRFDDSENMLSLKEAVHVQGKRSLYDTPLDTQENNKELHKRLTRSRNQLKQLQLKINELGEEFKKCDSKDGIGEVIDKQKINRAVPTVFIVTPTFKRFVQKAELTRVSQALKGVRNLHWIVVEDSLRKSKLVEQFLKSSGLKYTHLNIRTPEIFQKRKGEFRRFKPRGVFQRNVGIQWMRDNINPEDTPGVVYFADDDNTYDSRLFEEIRWIKGVGVWPVAFTGAARWAGPVCQKGKVIRFHTNWGRFRPFPIDMAGFGINIKKLITEYPHAEFKAMKRPGMLESSLLRQITAREELEPLGDCQKVFVWHTRTQKPRDSIIGEKELREEGRPSNPNIET